MLTDPNDPAFARTFGEAERRERIQNDDYGHGYAGLSTRAYFAARAPAVVPEWFKPEGLPPVPEQPKTPVRVMEAGAAKQRVADEAYAKASDAWLKAMTAWTEATAARERLRAAQWPWAWADLVLGAQ